MNTKFRIGITPDFYTEAKGKFEAVLEEQLGGAAGVELCITPNAVRRPVAEAILTLIFALLKNLPEQDSLTRAGKWRGDLTRLGRNIPGHTLGSVGCGNIARELLRLARPLGFSRLLAADPYVKPEQAAELGVEMVDIDTLFRESDFVTINT